MVERKVFFKTPIGVTTLVNIGILTITWCLMIGWRYGEDIPKELTEPIDTKIYFFIAIIFVSWFLTILLFVVFTCGRCLSKSCSVLMVILCGVLGAAILVASAFIALEAKRHKCSIWNCRMVDTVAAFGFLCTIGLVIEAFMYFFIRIFRD